MDIVIASDSQARADAVANRLALFGHVCRRAPLARVVEELVPGYGMAVLDAGDDVAVLRSLVDAIYTRLAPRDEPPVVGVLTREALASTPSPLLPEREGHAAILAVAAWDGETLAAVNNLAYVCAMGRIACGCEPGWDRLPGQIAAPYEETAARLRSLYMDAALNPFARRHAYLQHWWVRILTKGTLGERELRTMVSDGQAWSTPRDTLVRHLARQGALSPDDIRWLLEALPVGGSGHKEAEAARAMADADTEPLQALSYMLRLGVDWAVLAVLSRLPDRYTPGARTLIEALPRYRRVRSIALASLTERLSAPDA